jgi:hypothetical protein
MCSRSSSAGCRVAGLRQAYEDAYADWCAWAHVGGYSPNDAEWSEDRREAHDQWYGRSIDGIRRTAAAVVEAGCRDDVDQETLF